MHKIIINQNGINKIPIDNKYKSYKIKNYKNKNKLNLLNKRSLFNRIVYKFN